MKKSYYHATPFENLDSIIADGLKRGYDGVVYLAETPEDALKFLRIRFCTDTLVIRVDLEEAEVEESFDHSQAFFQCRAFMYPHDIPSDELDINSMTRWISER